MSANEIPFKVNSPPVGVTVTAAPSTNEVANKANNPFSRFRYSADGRRLIADVNGQPFALSEARRILCEPYPAGLDPAIDASKQLSGSSAVASLSVDVNWGYRASKNATVASDTHHVLVPAGNAGSLRLNITNNPSTLTVQYSKNGGAATTFTNGTVLAVANNDSFRFQILAAAADDEVTIALLENN